MPHVVDHLCQLIRISSMSSETNRAVIEYASQHLRQAGWHCRELTYYDGAGVEKVNLIAGPARDNLDAREVALAFVCHTDTVPYAADWKNATDPFEADGFIHGCGACDVKGFLACLLTAAEDADPSTLPPGLRIILTADEEVGCVGAARLIAEDRIRPHKVVVGEPTSLHPARAGKGYALAEFTIHGQEAHSALPASGVSAIYGAARLIAAIEAYAAKLVQEQNQIFAPAWTTLNVGKVEGGTAKNIIAGKCSFLLEWRPIPNQDPSEVFRSVVALAEEMATKDATFRYSTKLLRQQPGFETDAASSLVSSVEKFCHKAPASIPFGSEASLFAVIADEVIVFGPGDMQTAHSDRECVPVEELHLAVACLKELMTRSL